MVLGFLLLNANIDFRVDSYVVVVVVVVVLRKIDGSYRKCQIKKILRFSEHAEPSLLL